MSKTSPTRRTFTRTLALAATAPVLLATAAVAEDDPPMKAALALAEVVRLRHGKDLTEEQLARMAKSILHHHQAAERLRKFPLANGDEPALAFTADVP